MALKNLAFDSSAVPKEQSSANVVVKMPGNIDEAPSLIVSPPEIMSLVEALLDDAAEVRHAAEQALAQISGPVVADLGALLEEELNFEAAEVVESFSTPKIVAFQETPFQNLTIEERMVEKPMSEATEVRASTICLEEAFQKAMQELKHRLLEAEDLTRKRNELVQKAMHELEHRLLEAEDLTWKTIELETAQRAEVHTARCAETQQALRELEERHEKELALLSSQVGEFKHALEVVTQQRAGVEEARIETAAQIRQLDEEKAELEGAAEARLAEAQRLRIEAEHHRAGVEEVRLKTAAQIQRFDEEKAELDAAVEACKAEAQRLRIEAERQRAGVEEVRLETETQVRRFDEEKAELQAAVEARLTEAERFRIEAERQLSEAENRSRTEQEQFLLQTANLERVIEEVARRRANGEASLQKANEEDGRLLELQQSMEHRRRETAAQMRRLDEEKAELVAAVEAQRTGVEPLRLETEDQIRRFDEERAELEAAVEARRAGVEQLRLETEAQIGRLDEVKAKLEAAVEARQAGVVEVRLESAAQMRRFDEEKAELAAAVEARQAGAEEVRLDAAAQMRRFDEEKAELAAAVEARQAGVEQLRLDAEAQIRRFDEVKAKLAAAVEARRAGVEEVCLETEAQIRRFDEVKAKLAAAVEARQAEAERLRIESERQLSEAESRSRAEQERFLLQTADLERVTEEVARRRAEVEASLQKANEEDGRLLEMQQATQRMRLETAARMRGFDEEKAELDGAVEARQAEAERLRIEAQRQLSEAEKRNRVEQEQFLLENANLERLTEEVAQRRVEVEASLHKALEEDLRLLEIQRATDHSRRPASVESLWLEPEICERTDMVELAQERAERLRQLINEVHNLQFGEVKVRKQSERAEYLSEEAQEHNRHAVEELERISYGAKGQAIQEEQMQSKLEDIPRPLVVATQATAQLADLPEEEVENLQSLKSEQEDLVEERKSAAVSIVG